MATPPINIYGDTVNAVLNLARARVLDLVLTPAGFPSGSDPGRQFNEAGGGANLSTGTNSDGSLILRTQVIFNAAWRKFQKYLGNIGYRMLIADNVVVASLPANTNVDPTVQSWLSWNGFYNGSTFASSPALPADFYAPLRIQERISPTGLSPTAYNLFTPMQVALQGLRNSVARNTLNRQWEWRTGALYLPGTTGPTDLQFRYTRRLPDLPDPNYYVPSTAWYNQILAIPDCLSPLAWYVAYEAMMANPDTALQGSDAVLQMAEDEADRIFNDQAKSDQKPPRVNEGIARSGSSGGPGSSGRVQ